MLIKIDLTYNIEIKYNIINILACLIKKIIEKIY